MTRKFLLTISNLFKSFISTLTYVPTFAKNQISKTEDEFHKLRYNLQNLAASNMDLGIYHLRCRNYNDAIFRFKLVDRFLDPDNKLANYWLGWVYFMKLNYKKSIVCLTKAGELDTIRLLDFVKSIDNVTSIPPEIHAMHRDIMTEVIVDKYVSKEDNLIIELVSEFNSQAQDLPEEYSILELGANIGMLGDEINKRMQETYRLTGVEISEKMIDLQSKCFPDRKLYDRVVNSSIESFLDSESAKYDVVYSLDGFVTNIDLKKVFTSVFSTLNNNGYFAFVVKTDKHNRLSAKLLEFVYNSQYVRGALEESGFKILSVQEFSLEIKNNYSIFVCTK